MVVHHPVHALFPLDADSLETSPFSDRAELEDVSEKVEMSEMRTGGSSLSFGWTWILCHFL